MGWGAGSRGPCHQVSPTGSSLLAAQVTDRLMMSPNPTDLLRFKALSLQETFPFRATSPSLSLLSSELYKDLALDCMLFSVVFHHCLPLDCKHFKNRGYISCFQDSPTEPGAELKNNHPLRSLVDRFIFNTGSSTTLTRRFLQAVSSCCSVYSVSVRTAFCSTTEHPTNRVLSNQIT